MNRFSLPQVSDCNNCGACCTEMGGTVVGWYLGVHPMGDASRLPPALLAEMQAMAEEWKRTGYLPDDAPCVWYDAELKRCKHHVHRPALCREFEAGSAACHRWRQATGLEPKRTFRLKNGRLIG